MKPRHTQDGSDALEAYLDELCAKTSAAVRNVVPDKYLAAVLLGGGYGRGEGGVLRTAEGDKPYNDLEFYVLLRNSSLPGTPRIQRALHHPAEELTNQAGVEIELKALPLKALEQSEVTMFYYDLIMGHKVVHGDETCLANCSHHRSAHRIPLHEAVRLLMNRCSGLLYAQTRLARDNFSREDADFTGRNLAKAKLAFGDVLLAARGQYHWSCRERHKRLKKIEDDNSFPGLDMIVPLHEQGVEFKLHPRVTDRSREELSAELNFLKPIGLQLWLWLESRRLGAKFSGLESYAFSNTNKCPEKPAWKNRLINLRTFKAPGLFDSSYPRQRLLNSLPLLLWADNPVGRPEVLHFVQDQLKTGATTAPELVEAYQSLWRNYN